MADWEEFLICPHCRNPDQDWWDGLHRNDDGDTWSANCGCCGKDYTVTISVGLLFSTSSVNREAGDA